MAKEIGTSDLLETWGSDGVIVEPSDAKKANGWDLGEQPPHEYANYVLNILGQAINHIFKNGIPLWNATTPYVENNIVQQGGVIYRARQASTNSEPPNINWLAVAPIASKNSIEFDDGSLQLSNDESAPGSSRVYGTNSSGVKGWQSLPSQADGFTTGDIKLKYGDSEEAGYVRCNGRTMGSASSGATERANADTEVLFKYLWNTDPNLSVSGGRGVSANSDWSANKRITLPDAKSRSLVALDGMGGSATDRINASGAGNSGLDASILGASGGVDRHAVSETEMPSHAHSGNTNNAGSHAHSISAIQTSGGGTVALRGGDVLANQWTASTNSAGNHTHTFNTNAVGGGLPHQNVQPSWVFGTVYLKL